MTNDCIDWRVRNVDDIRVDPVNIREYTAHYAAEEWAKRHDQAIAQRPWVRPSEPNVQYVPPIRIIDGLIATVEVTALMGGGSRVFRVDHDGKRYRVAELFGIEVPKFERGRP